MSVYLSIEIGKIIKSLRKAMNLTQKDIANAIGVSAQQIHKYENGIDNINIVTIKKLESVFKVDILSLLPKTNTLKVSENKKKFDYKVDDKNNDAIELLKKFYSLNQSEKDKILKFVDDITKKNNN